MNEGTVEKAYIVGFQRLFKVLLSQCVNTSCSKHVITPTCCESKQHISAEASAGGIWCNFWQNIPSFAATEIHVAVELL
jgi:hypothetical protein